MEGIIQTLSLLGAIIAVAIPIMRILIKMNGNLVRNNVLIEEQNEINKETKSDRQNIHLQLNDHETRITVLEEENKYEKEIKKNI